MVLVAAAVWFFSAKILKLLFRVETWLEHPGPCALGRCCRGAVFTGGNLVADIKSPALRTPQTGSEKSGEEVTLVQVRVSLGCSKAKEATISQQLKMFGGSA